MIDTKAVVLTVSVAGLEVTAPQAAVIVVVPVAREVAKPLEPGTLLIEATEPFEETQVADVVRF